MNNRIILTTLNARYSHASLGLRCLFANLGDLQAQASIHEFVIGLRPVEVVERLLALQPRIIGFGVYIWNVDEITRIVALLKKLAPEVTVVIGGPEVSYETDEQPICTLADYTITGWGDISFATLCTQVLSGNAPATRVIAGVQPPLDQLQMPYRAYSDRDIAQRNLYVEASRGCPFKCEFCLSALDKTAWPFPLDAFLAELEHLYQRGARRFKFVDRTFNLNIRASQRILDFFLGKLSEHPDEAIFAHFELVPDHLPDALKETIARFPAGCLQFEIGIQTFTPEVQQRISRKQDNAAAEANLRWLREHSTAHLHADLIAGLPGESLASFAAGFDRLVALRPHEVQLGILKRLRGTPITRHTEPFGMVFDPQPPYALLANHELNFVTMQRIARFARYWDLVANSGRFSEQLPALLADAPFARFMAFSDWLYQQTDATGRLSPERLGALLAQWLVGDTSLASKPSPDPSRGRALARQSRHEKSLVP
jgi:radical SAM superfamily enzyme YgiQ (UPF0313 family)